MREQIALQNFLRGRFEETRIRNPAISVRAFAKRIGLSPATLSLILNGRRKISRKLMARVADKLMLDPMTRSEFLAWPAKSDRRVDAGYVQLNADQFHLIADWRAFAVLNLIATAGFRSDPDWIAGRLGISPKQAVEVIDRLFRLGLLKRDRAGHYERDEPKYRTKDDIADLSLRKSHHQTLEIAAESLENDAVDLRDFTWLTIPFDTRRLKEAKTLIRKFQDDFAALVGEKAVPDEVYRLSIQFFPLSKKSGPISKRSKSKESQL